MDDYEELVASEAVLLGQHLVVRALRVVGLHRLAYRRRRGRQVSYRRVKLHVDGYALSSSVADLVETCPAHLVLAC